MPSGAATASSKAGAARRRKPRHPASITSSAADQKRSQSISSYQILDRIKGARTMTPGQKLFQEMTRS